MSYTISYKIIGTAAQVLEINLEPGKTLIADGGALLYLDEEIVFETRDTDGSLPLEEENEKGFLQEDNPVYHSDWEETEKKREGTLLEKLWVATKKALSKVGSKQGEEEEPGFPEEGSSNYPEEMPELMSESPAFSWYITHFTNESEYIRKIAFTTAQNGIILPINLSEMIGNEVIAQTGTFLCTALGTKLTKFFDSGISLNFTREKFYNLDKISGDSLVFLQAEGQVIQKELENDAIRINLFSLIAFESSLHIDFQDIKKVQSMRYEDETLFVHLSGTGKFWIQTANLQHLIYKISPFVYEASRPGASLPEEGNSLKQDEYAYGLNEGIPGNLPE